NKARFIGLRRGALRKRGYLDVLSEKVVGPREFAVFSLADPVPALEPLVLPAALHSLFADQATRTVEPRMTAAGAERVMQVLDWLRQLPPTMWIAAVMAEGDVHDCPPAGSAWVFSSTRWVCSLFRVRAGARSEQLSSSLTTVNPLFPNFLCRRS